MRPLKVRYDEMVSQMQRVCVSEVNLGLMSHQQRGYTKMGPRLKVSSLRPEKQGINLSIPGLVFYLVIHYTTATPREDCPKMFDCLQF